MIDLHAHLLHGIDDGPADLDGSLALARAAVAAGTTVMAATPHVSPRYPLTAAEIGVATAVLGIQLAHHEDIGLEMRSGAEVAMPQLPQLDDAALRTLSLGGGGYVLLEAPLSQAAGDVERPVLDLLARGHRVLLAHPERSPSFQRNPELLADLAARGVLTQITGDSLTGRFGDTVRKFTLRLVRERLAHVLASDAHDANGRGPDLRPGLAALERELGGDCDELVEFLTLTAPAAVLAGQEPGPPPPPPKLGLLRRLRRR